MKAQRSPERLSRAPSERVAGTLAGPTLPHRPSTLHLRRLLDLIPTSPGHRLSVYPNIPPTLTCLSLTPAC